MRIFVHELWCESPPVHGEDDQEFKRAAPNLWGVLQVGYGHTFQCEENATKKWFGGRQDKIPVAPVAPDVPKYLREAPELQMRRLADLAFLVQMYELAYTSYHTAKRDFSNDQAWMHLAGALEMAAISAFMHGNLQKAYPQHYMEHASHYYADVCKKINFASRNVMLYAEILKAKKMYNEAAMDFIKMTGEDSDLRSALFLEQASLCFIALPKPKVRKYAFHMILAGHRFSKASQVRLLIRHLRIIDECYARPKEACFTVFCQALQVYKGKGWRLAEDHINFTIGRQCLNLRQLENATSALRHLLTQESHQPAAQQGSFLREYLFVFKQLTEQKKNEGQEQTSLPQLPLPIINKSAIRVLLTKPNRPQFSEKTAATSVTFDCILNRTEMKEWQRLEEIALLYKNFHKKIQAGFKPFVHLFHSETDNSVQPLAVLTEPITVEILMENPLKIPLVLSQIHLLWRFIPVDFEVTNRENPEQKPVAITNEMSEERDSDLNAIIETEYLEEVSLLDLLEVNPMQTGELHITGLGYGLSSQPNLNSGTNLDSGINDGKRPPTFSSSVVTIPGMQELDIQGPRLNSTTIERCSVMYGPDRRLDPIIVPHMPNLEVLFHDFPSTLLSGEVCLVTVEFINEGHCSLNNLLVASDHPEFFTFGFNQPSWEGEASQSSISNQLSGPRIYRSMQESAMQRQTEEQYVAMCNVSHVVELPLEGGVLGPGCRLSLPMWVRGPETSGVQEIKMLFMYRSEQENVKMRHRTLHHTIVINTASSVSLSGSAHRGQCSDNSQDSGDLQLSVQLAIENMNQLHDSNIAEFSIRQVSCVSSRWSLFPAEDITEDMKILGGESLRVNFRARQHNHYSQGEVSNKLLAFSNCCFGKNIVDSTSTPCVDFCFRTLPDALPNQGNSGLLSSTATSTPTISPSPSSHELSLLAIQEKARLKEDLECSQAAEMLLVVLWKAFVVDDDGESHALVGQNHISIIVLDQEETTILYIRNLTKSNSSSFRKIQNQPTKIFQRPRLCRVPIQLQIYNCCQCELEVFIETNPADNRLSQPTADYSAIFLPPDSSTFAWCSLSSEVINIPPSKRANRHATRLLRSPGCLQPQQHPTVT
ncbi:putative trafficking protein particle complex subunit 8 [Apostichopus japonicus]|uniref:Putative trafficking protein particle complex subunit 8 n=1 Tax=Stichopus japonicus TaxID=307972 RepID=A0A2G8JDI6_STIJA|nr:putative trafficking protein particle complex subunit 8 [Apostichopus japonicus]